MFEITSTVRRCCMLLVAIVVASIALPLTAKAAAPTDRVPSLVRETLAQFQIAYRMHPEEGQRRQEQLAAVVNAWRAAPRADANNDRLTNWLRAAIRASMPGSREALPASPTFTAEASKETRSVVKPTALQPTLAEPIVAKPTPAAEPSPLPSKHTSEADPFRDDPEDE
jgi:hypothetical protein